MGEAAFFDVLIVGGGHGGAGGKAGPVGFPRLRVKP
jgi:hypothetical protein